jgi:hypothetical protein
VAKCDRDPTPFLITRILLMPGKTSSQCKERLEILRRQETRASPLPPFFVYLLLDVQLAHRRRVSLGLVGTLLGGLVRQQDHGADHFIAPLDPVHKLQLQLRKVVGLHRHRPPAATTTGDL